MLSLGLKRQFLLSCRAFGAAPSQTSVMIDDVLHARGVAIFTKTHCPYCKKAKKTLDKAFVDYEEIDILKDELGHEIQDELERRVGLRTVP